MGSGSKSLFWTVVVLFAVSAIASAVPLTLTNPNFDDSVTFENSLPDGTQWTIGTVPGWVVQGIGGVFQPTTQITPLSGATTAYMDNQAAISQILVGQTAAANTTYTLSVGVGARGDGVPLATWRLELYSGMTLLACVDSAVTAPGQTGCTVSAISLPGAGQWTTANLSYTTAADFVGGDLAVRIATFDVNPGVADQLDFDNVVLDAASLDPTGVPEPMTLALTGAGLVGIAVIRRKFAHK